MYPGIMSKKNKILININPLSEKSLLMGKGEKRARIVTSWRDSSTSTELTRSESVWRVTSSQSEEQLIRFLRLKFFWTECSILEQEAMFSHPRFLEDLEFNVLLTLLAKTELSREEITERAEQALRILGKHSNFRKRLLPQWENNIFLKLERTTRTIRKHKAYSGWVRNASSVGSKKGKLNLPEPLVEITSEEQFDEFNFLFELISVGYIEATSGSFIRLP
jgi:hypothetical protein